MQRIIQFSVQYVEYYVQWVKHQINILTFLIIIILFHKAKDFHNNIILENKPFAFVLDIKATVINIISYTLNNLSILYKWV